jgi:hypothetical protein
MCAPLAQAHQQLVGRHVHHDRLVGRVEERVGNGLVLADARDLAHDVVQAFEVLDAHRREHVDAGGEKLVGILPALGMARPRGVRVREVVDEDDFRIAAQGGVEVQLECCGLAVDRGGRQSLEPVDENAVHALVRVHDRSDHILPRIAHALRRGEHRVGLAGAGEGAEEHLQLAALHVTGMPGGGNRRTGGLVHIPFYQFD